ncbi:Caspase-1-like protein, partial [Leptotrombidium deliense]
VYFESIGFCVNVINDAKLKTIQETLRDYANGKHGTNIGCFLCFVLTHGNKNKLCANDTVYFYEELYTPFLPANCEFLNGKHKIFVINACQDDPEKGINYDPGNKYYTDAANLPIHTPEDDDFLVALSSVPGFTTMRSVIDGSFFIQCLFECLEANRREMVKDDFVSLLINTGRRMAVDVSRNYGRFSSLDPKKDKCDKKENQKQMPIFFTTLREHLFI